MNDINTIYDAITKRRCCSNGGSSDDGGSSGGATVGGLIVRGHVYEDSGGNILFAPENGEASFSDARDAYLSGIPVMYSITRQDQDADETDVAPFMGYFINRKEEPALEAFYGMYDGDNFEWFLESTNDGDEDESPKQI